MAIGGIPYYLRYVEAGQTSDQIIQYLLFNQNSPLRDEFYKLFHSLFENVEAYIELIILISKEKSGMTRSDIKSKARLSTNGGRFTERLKDLCLAGFLEEKLPWNKKLGKYYRLIDEFSLFQTYWIFDRKNKKFPEDNWLTMSKTQAYKAWSGYTY